MEEAEIGVKTILSGVPLLQWVFYQGENRNDVLREIGKNRGRKPYQIGMVFRYTLKRRKNWVLGVFEIGMMIYKPGKRDRPNSGNRQKSWSVIEPNRINR